MFEALNIRTELGKARQKQRTAENNLIKETRRILNNDLLAEKKILENLGRYNASFFIISEEEVDETLLYTESEIRQTAESYRLKFLESRYYRPDIPYQAVAVIKELNALYRKNLKQFKVLAPAEDFRKELSQQHALLFVETNHGNYYLVHHWGKTLPWRRRILCWPLKRFETLALTIIAYTLLLTLVLPTWAITLDEKATYWSGYRGGVFFHLLIFNSGFTALVMFSYFRNFSGSLWNRRNDFD